MKHAIYYEDDLVFTFARSDIPPNLRGVNGTKGDDHLVGVGNRNEYFHGEGGNDTIEGGNGQDFCDGDAGNDTLRGGKGHDYLIGDGGNDQLWFTGGGNVTTGDILLGKSGTDTFRIGDGGGRIDDMTGKEVVIDGNGERFNKASLATATDHFVGQGNYGDIFWFVGTDHQNHNVEIAGFWAL